MDVRFYSQQDEDKYIIQYLLKEKIKDGTYLEIGACDGLIYSNTKTLEEFFGFQGILIEPQSNYFKKLLKILKQKKIKIVLLEGGGVTNWTFVKENLVDDIIITITPYLVGGNTATTLVDGIGFSKIIGSTKLKLKNVRKVKNEIILHYQCI